MVQQFGKWAFVVSLALAGCSHGPKRVKYDATSNPTDVIQNLDADIQNAYAAQVDVLAPSDFASGRDLLSRARGQIRDGASQEKVLRTLGDARAYLSRAVESADSRRGKLEGVLSARQSALNAGARNFPLERQELAAADQEVRGVLDARDIRPATFSDLQKRYINLELAAIQSSHLNEARARIEGSKKKNAARFTPRTLNRAQLDMKNAENMISAHRHDEASFRPAVDRVNASSLLLSEAVVKVRSGRAVLPEDVALKLVYQERGLRKMGDRLEALESQATRASETLNAQDVELKKARETQALEKALAQARKEFASNEADVYRDGPRLLIRLKAMKFSSGRSDLPSESIPLLSKVRSVAEDLNPSLIIVEGHTDSTGSAAINLPLSQRRAEAVATYLHEGGMDSERIQAVGLGFKKPIANNRSKAGRAQNRRVDVIITPSAVETSTTSM